MSNYPHSKRNLIFFYSYSHKDRRFRAQLDRHLSDLKNLIETHYDCEITAGKDWEAEIKKHLEEAHVILLLISSYFMASPFIKMVELKRAMERHETGEARVIPIFLSPVIWQAAPFGKLQGLPPDARPVTDWKNHDSAFMAVAQGIKKVVEEMISGLSQEAEVTGYLSLPPDVPPPPSFGFVARQDKTGRDIVEQLKKELSALPKRLVALIGAGGVGKTTLAAEAVRALARDFPGRIVWLSAETRADFTFSTLLDEIADQLGEKNLSRLPLEEKQAKVRALVAEPPTLIVLDNFEAIRKVEQTSCANFLATQPRCPTLITSRERVSNAYAIYVYSMLPEEANQFLEKLIGQMPDSRAISAKIRRRIIETADARPYVMRWVMAHIDQGMQSPHAVLEDLKQGKGGAAKRVFDHTFRLPQVGDDGRATLLALSLFVPSASRPALAEVAGFGEDIMRLDQAIKSLSAFLLVRGIDENERLTMEGLTLSLAKTRLADHPLANEFRQRFVAYFKRHTESHSEATPEDYDALEAEKDNILSAIERAFDLEDWESVQLIANVFAHPANGMLSVHGYWDETIRAGEQALRAARNSSMEIRIAKFAHAVAVMYQCRGELEEARRLYDESLEISRKLDDHSGIATALHQLGRLADDQGELEEARRLYEESLAYEESLETSRKLGNQRSMAMTLHQLGGLAQAQDQLAEARRLYEESLKIKRGLGKESGIALTLHNLALIAQAQGQLEEARLLYEEGLEISRKLRDQAGIAMTLRELGRLSHEQGKLLEAQRLYDESLEISRKLGSQSNIAMTLHQLGRLADDQGELVEARRFYEESLETSRKLGNQRSMAMTLHQLGKLADHQGQLAEARRLYEESLKIKRGLGKESGIALTLHNLALIAQAQGQLEEARLLYEEGLEISRKLRDQAGIAMTLHQLAMLTQDQGKIEEAQRLYNESLEIKKRLGNQSGIAITLGQLGLLAEKDGNKAQAAQLTREALGIFEKLKSPYTEVARRNLERLEGEVSLNR